MAQNIFKIYGEKVSFSQWEKRQKLIVLNESIQEVHFSNKNMMHSIQRDVYKDVDGLMVCNVPDDLLKLPINLVADAYTDGVLVKSVKFAVIKRPIPGDYISDQSDVDENQDQRLAVLEKSMGGTSDIMHFKGQLAEIPHDIADYIKGDVVSVGQKDYLFNGVDFTELGDSSTHHEHKNKNILDDIENILNDKLDSSKLDNAVDGALLKAKDSGDFNGKDGISVSHAEINNDGQLILTLSDNTVTNLGVVVGANGDKGEQGIQGEKGRDGIDGQTPYIKDGNWWVGSNDTGIKAEGIDGKNGTDGKDGVNGTSVTHSWNGTVLTITSSSGVSSSDLKGEKGDRGEQGAQGIQGIQGEKGVAGQNGVSITKTEINSKGELIITLSDNSVSNLGVVVGANGDKGDKGDQGVQGETGAAGQDGSDGKDGVGISDIVIDNGNLKITLTSGNTLNLGNIKGENGDDGSPGKDGTNGTDGHTPVKGTDYYTEADKQEMVTLVLAALPNGDEVSY